MTENKGCVLCPRKCHADRTQKRGFCGSSDKVKIARVGLHNYEEPCISYGKGSGTVFFSGCPLKCVFCQNYEISQLHKGREIDASELCEIFLRVQDMGAVNLNLVNPTHYSKDIIYALEKVKDKLKIPVIYNTGGYDDVTTLKGFSGLVDIYLPDLKYYGSEYSEKYSGASDYFEVASAAIDEMLAQVGYPVFSPDGKMLQGVLIRHLVLPLLYRDSFKILEYLSQRYDTEKLYISLMSQYFPTHRANEYHEISRTLTTLEYEKVLSYAEKCGIIHGFSQEKASADAKYVPIFDF